MNERFRERAKSEAEVKRSGPVVVGLGDVVHDLKCWPDPFKSLRLGFKNYEWRVDDCDPAFDLGHVLCLREYNPITRLYSGEVELRRVGHIMRGCYGIPKGYCIMSWDTRYAPESVVLMARDRDEQKSRADALAADLTRSEARIAEKNEALKDAEALLDDVGFERPILDVVALERAEGVWDSIKKALSSDAGSRYLRVVEVAKRVKAGHDAAGTKKSRCACLTCEAVRDLEKP